MNNMLYAEPSWEVMELFLGSSCPGFQLLPLKATPGWRPSEILPGANCGPGYAGCSNYGVRWWKESSLNACIPGEPVRPKRRRDGAVAEEVAPWRPSYSASAIGRSAERFIYHGIEDCAEAESICGAKACLTLPGLGNCVRACPLSHQHGGPRAAAADLDKCNGCGLCREACPRKIIQILPKSEAGHLVLCNSHDRGKSVTRACTVGCTACRICVKACPREAIAIENNLAVIDLEKCDDCGECAKACPQGTIHPRRRVAEQSRARVG